MYLYISQDLLKHAKRDTNLYYPGNVFIEILKNYPRNNKANKAMIYCVGPEGDTIESNLLKNKIINKMDLNNYNMNIEKVFLSYVNIVGKNIATAINLYNNNMKEKQKRIDYVRICLISGLAFLPNHMRPSNILQNGILIDNKVIIENSQKKVAKQIISGIHSINKNSTIIDNIVYEFAWTDNAFINAFDDIKKINSGELADFQNYVN